MSVIVQGQAEGARSHTYPLFAVFDGKHGVNGSGVLLASTERNYLVTARHVGLESDRTKLIGNDGVNPFGEFLILPKVIDVTIVEILIPTFFESLGYAFLPIEFWGINHALRHREIEPHYLVLGYPSTKTRSEVIGRTVNPRPYGFWTRLYGQEEMGCDPLTQLALRFVPNKIHHEAKGFMQAPKLDGMSGCGIWDTSGKHPVLVGLLTDQQPMSLIGTRIDAFSEVVREALDITIPRSSRLGVSIKMETRS